MMISCIILAGGKSERMGRDKKLIKMHGKYILEMVIESALKFSDEIIISLSSKKQANALAEIPSIKNFKIVIDEIPSKGPIGGIEAGLKNCSGDYAVILPCDSPFIQPKVFEHLIKKCHSFDAIVPKHGNLIEPLHAVYNVLAMKRACEETLKMGPLDIKTAISKLKKVKYIPVEEFKKYDPNLLTLYNLNTPEDLRHIYESKRILHSCYR